MNFKIYGVYAAIILVAVLNLMFMHIFAKYRVKFSLKSSRALGLIKAGFPVTIVSLLQWVLESLDRIMIAKMIGVTFVGFYSIPIMAKSYVGQLSSFGTVLYPRLMETYGKDQKVEDIKKYVIVPSKINAYILPMILGVIFFAVPLLVKKILPKFVPGILAMQILLLGMFFESCRGPAFHFIIAIKKQARAIPIAIGAIILNVAGNFILIKMGYSIYGVAWATSFVLFLNFVAFQTYAMKHFAGAREIMAFFLEIVIPVIYTVILVISLGKAVMIRNEFAEVLVRCCLLIIFSIPLLAYINNSTRIISMSFNIVKNKIISKG